MRVRILIVKKQKTNPTIMDWKDAINFQGEILRFDLAFTDA